MKFNLRDKKVLSIVHTFKWFIEFKIKQFG